MVTPREKYWFPAKRFGWGWGFPTCWQGWAVFAAYFVVFLLGVVFLRGRERAVEFIVFVSVSTLARKFHEPEGEGSEISAGR